MPLPQTKQYTIEDIYALPNGERAELVDGNIYYMYPPSRTHQRMIKIYVEPDISVICDENKLTDGGVTVLRIGL